jgi:predicted DNA binding protein
MPRYNAAANNGSTTTTEPPTAVLDGMAAPATTPTPPAQPTGSSVTLAPGGGLKRVSFGKIAKKDETKATSYPVFPDPSGTAADIAVRIKERTEQLEALTGAIDTDKAELKFMVTPYYFSTNHGKAVVPSSIAVNTKQGEVLVTFQNRYSLLTDELPVARILGDDLNKYFRQTFEVKIKGDALPVDKTQALMDRLQALFEEFEATAALEVKDGVKPVADFHTSRHTALTPEQNMAVEAACPIITMIKTKGRKAASN